MSARHLSFVETGRSKPSRELVLHLAEHLDVPLRERNSLLLAAGYAPAYQERSLDDADMDPVRDALDLILAGHEPYPAVIVDRRWDLVTANACGARRCSPPAWRPPCSSRRSTCTGSACTPTGWRPRVRNLAEYSAHLLTRLQREVAVSGDAGLAALLDEVRGYPNVTPPGVDRARRPGDDALPADAVRGARRDRSCRSSARSPRSAPRSTSRSPSCRSRPSSPPTPPPRPPSEPAPGDAL